jgi:hypothetical protein
MQTGMSEASVYHTRKEVEGDGKPWKAKQLSEEHNKFMKSATHKKMHDFFFFFPQK